MNVAAHWPNKPLCLPAVRQLPLPVLHLFCFWMFEHMGTFAEATVTVTVWTNAYTCNMCKNTDWANEMLHFMLHETENGIWEEVDSASSQRTRSSLSIPPQEKKNTAMQLPAQSSKRQWTIQAVTANNKLINDTVTMWLVQMKCFSNSIQWEHK